MLHPEKFIDFFKKKKINFFCGVPDSVLKNFTNALDQNKNIKHIININEGSAVSMAAGYNLNTKKIPCVYMQNSGLGNCFNPLISIIHKKVYKIPMILIIGWRGHPNEKDEPQHNAMGRITKKTLNLLNVKICELNSEKSLKNIGKNIESLKKNKNVLAILVRPNKFHKPKKNTKKLTNNKKILRNEFLKYFLKKIPNKSNIISTTGYTSREIFQLREDYNLKKGKDFYMVGGMGHAGIVALGNSLQNKKEIFCLDGDGSILMHMGSLRTIGKFAGENFKHLLFNNYCHESVGGQTTYSFGTNYKNLVKSLGYKYYDKITESNKISSQLKNFINSKGPSFLEIIISNQTLNNLRRPKNLIKIKNGFENDK